MSEMVERVARILCEQYYCDPDKLEPGDVYGIDGYNRNDEPCHFMWREFVEKARAVIEAMREPTREMVLAGVKGVREPLGPPSEDGRPRTVALIYPMEGYAAASAFRLMIDEALSNKP